MSNLKLRWEAPESHWQLNGTDVHVWAADLDKTAVQISFIEQTLSPDERERAERFHFERDRNRFIAGRAILRQILGSYLDIGPSRLQFHYTSRGKPVLMDLPGCAPIHFNLAHSRDLILIAVTRACDVGIDVEWIHPTTDMENIVTQYFSTREVTEFMALPKDKRLHTFFRLWTRKEACLKAIGEGLSDTMGQFEVSFLPEEPAQVRAISGNRQAAESWTLMELSPVSEYVAAVAAPAKGLSFFCWQWPFKK